MYLFGVIPYILCKRGLDILLSLVALLVLWPVLLVVAVIVRCQMGAPVLFCQLRPGLHGKSFRLYKFRSMRMPRTDEEMLASDSVRLTALGAFLRKSSIDELPELWNILCGTMSFVGPRPLLPQYLGRYNARQARRHEVRPGLTGWAQVHGRNLVRWQDRLEMDVWYIEHMSFWLDLRIIGKTFALVFSAKNRNMQGQATMVEFMGNE